MSNTSEYNRLYYQRNKERINANKKKYREEHKNDEEYQIYMNIAKEKYKEYYEKNKEKIKMQHAK